MARFQPEGFRQGRTAARAWRKPVTPTPLRSPGGHNGQARGARFNGVKTTKAPLRVAALLFAGGIVSGCALNPAAFEAWEIADRANDNLARVDIAQEPVRGPIDLYEAMARALKFNLDHRVEIMEAALRGKEYNFAHYSMLPGVVANSGFTERNNVNASNSINILTGVESLATSTSQERRIKTSDIAFSWNILDFGLSYVRARQAGDKYLIAQELRRKVVHRIIGDVRTAFWRAVSADRLLTKLRALAGRVERARAASRAVSAERASSPITAVTYERELVEIKRAIQELQRDLSVARTQLAALMNLKPGTRFQLVYPRRTPRNLTLRVNARKMIQIALENRPELREVWYKQRINERDLDAALLELLPGLQVFATSNYNSNEFLYNNNWVDWGAKASWNLLKAVQYPARRRVIEAQDELLDARALALTMAIITQVHVSRVRFRHAHRELLTAEEYLGIQRRLVRLMRSEADSGRIGEQTLIREEMNALVAQVKRDVAYANLQNAFANVYTSMGLDPYREDIDTQQDTKSLARALRRLWFERGDFGGKGRIRLSRRS